MSGQERHQIHNIQIHKYIYTLEKGKGKIIFHLEWF